MPSAALRLDFLFFTELQIFTSVERIEGFRHLVGCPEPSVAQMNLWWFLVTVRERLRAAETDTPSVAVFEEQKQGVRGSESK